MSAKLDELAARKALLVARLRLERLQVALHAGELREAVRPAGLIGGAIAKPAAAVALVEAIAPLFGLRKFAYWVRIGSIDRVGRRPRLRRCPRVRFESPPSEDDDTDEQCERDSERGLGNARALRDGGFDEGRRDGLEREVRGLYALNAVATCGQHVAHARG